MSFHQPKEDSRRVWRRFGNAGSSSESTRQIQNDLASSYNSRSMNFDPAINDFKSDQIDNV